ncbi:MAG TPA: hypothetical protein EYN54_13080 [Methylococcaceae bacterium]|nr:hypothetical protein [Methylococcaceae bacterium]
MSDHHWLFMGLFSALFLFKRTRYASVVYVVPYVLYLSAHSNLLIPDDYYHAISATLNLFIFVALFVGYKCDSINDIFNLHKYNINQKVGLLSVLLVFINLVGYWKYYHGATDAIVYNSDYRFIVAVQLFLLYIGNMNNAWVDRRADKLSMVRLHNYDDFETFEELNTEEKR